MNSDELEKAIERAGEMTRAELIALVWECKAHLDLRQRLARDLANGVALLRGCYRNRFDLSDRSERLADARLTSAPEPLP